MTKNFVKFAIYPIIAMTLFSLFSPVNLIFINLIEDGDVTKMQVSYGLASIVIGLTLAFLSLFNMSLETLVSHSFGVKDYRACGVYLNRQNLLNMAFMITLLPVLLFGEMYLQYFNDDPNIVQSAATYLKIQIPSLFCLAFFDSYWRFTKGLNKTEVGFIANLASDVVYLVVIAVLIVPLGMGLYAVAFSQSLLMCLKFFIIYVVAHQYEVVKMATTPYL